MMRREILALVTVALLGANSLGGTYSGGTGEPNDPYRIGDANDLNALAANPGDWRKHFILTADVDLSTSTYTRALIAPDTSGTSYFQGIPFTGTFDGNGHRILNLRIDSAGAGADYLGLFGEIGSGQVKNLGLENVTVTGGDDSGHLGGLVGKNYMGAISNCYSGGSVSGRDSSDNLGGLVGNNDAGTISNCHSGASVTGGDGSEYVGGLVGGNWWGIISNSYSTGSVTAGEDSSRVGGLVGWDGAVANSFWDTQTSGQSNSAGGKGKTTAQMQTASTFIGWNGCGEVIWTLDEGNDYPRLFWEDKAGDPMPTEQLSDLVTGAGTESDPYLIYTAEELNMIGSFTCEWAKHFKLMADVDLEGFRGTEFNIIGSGSRFTGAFDGNGHTIRNFTYTSRGADRIGLFGYLGSGGQIKNLVLEDANINGNDCDSVGSLAGGSGGTISNCYVTGFVMGRTCVGGLVGGIGRDATIRDCYATGLVEGSFHVGGLVGRSWQSTVSHCHAASQVTGSSGVGGLVGAHESGTISSCWARGDVSGGSNIGGLVGENGRSSHATISDCYATGAVTGGFAAGGLLGYNEYDGSVKNCYSTGPVAGGDNPWYVGGLVGHGGRVANSFWDTQTSGQSNSDGGEGKTTAEMKKESTFTEAGWDFIETWNIGENQTYPFLRTHPAGDIDHDASVNLVDLAIMADHWLEGTQ